MCGEYDRLEDPDYDAGLMSMYATSVYKMMDYFNSEEYRQKQEASYQTPAGDEYDQLVPF